MFKVYFENKDTGKIIERKVYGVGKDKMGDPEFLIYEMGKWMWMSSMFYKPVKEAE